MMACAAAMVVADGGMGAWPSMLTDVWAAMTDMSSCYNGWLNLQWVPLVHLPLMCSRQISPSEVPTSGRMAPPDAPVEELGMRPSRLGKAPEVKESA
jgi:hypothetical protein